MNSTPFRIRSQRLPGLDALRGLAFVFVLVFHYMSPAVPTTTWETAAHRAIDVLWAGVDIFFVLSGYLITSILLETKDQGLKKYIQSFLLRRSFRIFPLYYATLLLLLVILPGVRGGAQLFPEAHRNQIFLWTYLANWPQDAIAAFGSMAHFWSLSVEEQFYLFWPWFVYFLPAKWIRVTLNWSLPALFGACCLCYWTSGLVIYNSTRWAGMLLGAWLALHIHEPFDRSLWRRNASRLLWLLIAGLFAATFGGSDALFRAIGVPLLTVAAATFVTLVCLDALPAACAPEWLQYLGRYSYFLYIAHFPIRGYLYKIQAPILRSVENLTHSALVTHFVYCVLSLLIMLPFAVLSWRFFERPLQKLAHRFDPIHPGK